MKMVTKLRPDVIRLKSIRVAAAAGLSRFRSQLMALGMI